MSRGRNPYRRAGSWVSGTGWTTGTDAPVDGQDNAGPEPAAVDELRHGYRLADLHAITRLAVHVAGRLATDWHERYDTAWSGIVEHLYAAIDPPTRQDLVSAGRLAIYAVVDGDRQAHGYYRRKNIGSAAGPCSSPAYRTYWLDWLTNVQHDHAPAVAERVALPSILAALTQRQREALLALAAHEDYARAADAMGVRVSTLNSYVSAARGRFFALWHEGETPGPRWVDRRVASHTSAAATRTSLADRMSARRARLRRTT
jgi:DNA-directed RNA polymerase specialized sigma24 family protein